MRTRAARALPAVFAFDSALSAKPKVLLTHGRRVLERRLGKAPQAARLLWGSAPLAVLRRFCRALQAGLKQNRRQSMTGTFGALPEQGLERCTAATEPGHFWHAPALHQSRPHVLLLRPASRWRVLCDLRASCSSRSPAAAVFALSSLLYYTTPRPALTRAQKRHAPAPLAYPF